MAVLQGSVHLVGGDVHYPGHSCLAACVHDCIRANAVGDDEVFRPGYGAVDVALGREMQHGVVALDSLAEGLKVADVGVDEPEPVGI